MKDLIFSLSHINKSFLDVICNYVYNIFCCLYYFCEIFFYFFYCLIDCFYKIFILDYSDYLWIIIIDTLNLPLSFFLTIHWWYSSFFFFVYNNWYLICFIALIASLYGEYFAIAWIIYKILEFFFEFFYNIGCWIVIFIFFGFRAFF